MNFRIEQPSTHVTELYSGEKLAYVLKWSKTANGRAVRTIHEQTANGLKFVSTLFQDYVSKPNWYNFDLSPSEKKILKLNGTTATIMPKNQQRARRRSKL
jgi:hypothetical protein